MIVCVLEYRELPNDKKEEGDFICDLAYIGSSLSSVMNYMLKNKDYGNRSECDWWWATYSMEIDKDVTQCTVEDDLQMWDWDGNNLHGYQPCYGYTEMYKYIESEKKSI